jgi:nitrogen fixation NifU-like protein
MSELEELYQEIIMEHSRTPRNFKEVVGANRSANGFNPFCGDNITLYVKEADGVVADVGFQGSGCAISRASASMMTESIKGKTSEQAERIFDAFHDMLTAGPSGEYDADALGDLEALAGVSEFPTRVKCATLSWHALKGALSGQEEVSTE